MNQIWQGPLEKIDDWRWQIPKTYKPGMRVPGLIYADEKMLKQIIKDKAPEQVANVAFLPGIVKYSLAMPDIHWGYGFSIGGVAATNIKEGGVISPAGVGYDINCGVRLIRTNLALEDVEDKIGKLMNLLYRNVPSGVGSAGNIRLSRTEEREMLKKGAEWAVKKGFGVPQDLEATEEYGAIKGADPDAVSNRAYERGAPQLGTLGSGNHFLEVQVVDQIYDQVLAEKFGIFLGQITVMIHTGSRGFGYQVCDDYVRQMVKCLVKYNIRVPDRQLACAPVESPEGARYLGAMRCAANYAWANRQCIMHLVRETFEDFFGESWQSLGMYLVYDVAHNIAKIEKHIVDGKELTLCVHRKGATRAFGPGHPDLPAKYKETGQPVIIPGDMGTCSFLLVGTDLAMKETFGTTCHGAGRVKSRSEAIRTVNFTDLMNSLEKKGIVVRATEKKTIVEEAPSAYKDVEEVVRVVDSAGISKKVARMRPLGVVKG